MADDNVMHKEALAQIQWFQKHNKDLRDKVTAKVVEHEKAKNPEHSTPAPNPTNPSHPV